MSEVIGLIGGASGRELVEQIRKQGYKVALVEGSNTEPGVECADYVFVSDLHDTEQIGSFFDGHNVRNLIIGTGHRFAFELGEELERTGITLNVNIAASETAKEKKVFKDLLVKKGFRTPAYVSIEDKNSIPAMEEIVDTTGLPCVVKATVDTMLPQKASSVDVLKEEIIDVLDSGSPAVIEQFIKGIDITVFVSAANGKAEALPICYYSKAEENNMRGFSKEEYMKNKLSPDAEKEIMRYCEEIVLACGFEGLPRIDLMVMPESDIYVLEANSVGVTGVNERHAAYCKGTVLYLRTLGIDVAEILVKNALNKFQLTAK